MNIFISSQIASSVWNESKSFWKIYTFYLLIVWGSDYTYGVSTAGKVGSA